MTEQEYIIVSQLARVRDMLAVLHWITPDIPGSPITQERYYEVGRPLSAWADELAAMVPQLTECEPAERDRVRG